MVGAAHTVVIRHTPGTDPPVFTVSRLSDGKYAPPVAIAIPNSVRIEGRPTVDLTHEIRWYLERFLDYPFMPDVEYAQRVQAAIRTWGQQAFITLFGAWRGKTFYEDAIRDGLQNLTVQVISDSPSILGWPWEALEDPERGRLAHQCNIERRTERQRDPAPLSTLPSDRVNVLLVIARPFQGDVKYRSVSRSLVELAASHTFPISIDVLRPPTFGQLREHLRTHPNHYHILHFDGHGTYHTDAPLTGAGKVIMRAAKGQLLFEKDNGSGDPIESERLSELLRENSVPAVVLNACQSAMIDERAEDPFASVAAALLKAGTRSVVAMAYALYVSGAQQFLPGFYRVLFETGSLATAVRAGRQQMIEKPGRVCARGTYPLDDWLVPVVYQQDPLDLSFVTRITVVTPEKVISRLPEAAQDDQNPYGFLGRDGALLALERAMHRQPAGILITGLGGVGKTTLARGFLRWLEQTGGLGAGALWFDFREVRSAEYVLNRIGDALTGKPEFATLGVQEKLAFLVDACLEMPWRIVWDNFESARGIADTTVAGNLSDADTGLLKEFLTGLHGGKSKVLITSRSPEEWLGQSNSGTPISLGGLDGEERWVFANAILDDLGLKQDPRKSDPNVKELMDLLKGHPLAMRVILPKLTTQSALQLVVELRTNLMEQSLATQDEAEAALNATLQFATDALPVAWQPILIPLGLHEGYVEADHLEAMAKIVDGGPTRAAVDECLQALVYAGLVRDLGQAIYELHPLLTSYLRAASQSLAPGTREAWLRAFVGIMASVADNLASRRQHEHRIPFLLHEGNFHVARAAAARLDMTGDYATLTQSLAFHAQTNRNYPAAASLYDELQAHHARLGDYEGQAAAYHQLGIVAQQRRDFDAAEQWYRRSLDITERLGNERGAVSTYHQMGQLAQERRDFDAAEQWYRKSLDITERLGNERGAVSTYHQMGQLAQERRDFDAAEQWYRKSLDIWERQVNEHGTARTYHNLGVVAQARKDLATAEGWLRKALDVEERLGDLHAVATSYHNLGIVSQERGDLAAAEGWLLKALDVEERLGDEHAAATCYHNLGIVAQEQGDLAAAEGWLRKALDVVERLGDEYAAATSYHQLGVVVLKRGDLTAADGWLRKALMIFQRLGDYRGQARAQYQLAGVRAQRQEFDGAIETLTEAATLFEQATDPTGVQAAQSAIRFLGTLVGKVATGVPDRAEHLVRESRRLASEGKFREAEEEISRQINLAKSQSDLASAAILFRERAGIRVRTQSYEPARWDYKKAIDLYGSLADLGSLARVEVELATLEFRTGLLADADQRLISAAKHAEEAQDPVQATEARGLRERIRDQIHRHNEETLP